MTKIISYLWKRKHLLALIMILLTLFTSNKIYGMLKIRNIIPNRIVETQELTDMAEIYSNNVSGKKTYYIAWNNSNISLPNPERTNISQEYWNNLNIGDEIDIIRLREGGRAYLEHGIYASNGNLFFDFVLLLFELTILFISLYLYFKEKRILKVATTDHL